MVNGTGRKQRGKFLDSKSCSSIQQHFAAAVSVFSVGGCVWSQRYKHRERCFRYSFLLLI